MGECRHDRRRAGSKNAVFVRDELEIANFFPKAVICQAFDIQDGIEISGTCDSIKKTNGREAAGNQPP